MVKQIDQGVSNLEKFSELNQLVESLKFTLKPAV